MAGTHTVTLLFTDLVGSTALSSSLLPGDAESLRLEHFALLRRAIDEAGGVEVKNLGDGLMVAFTSASRAIDGAVQMQQLLEQRNRRVGPPLRVRIGVAMGEAVEEDGDYFGDPVVEAARLCASAEGGQILTTALVRAAVGRRLGHDVVCVGERELKGLPDPVEVWDIRWAPAAEAGEGVPLPSRFGVSPAAPFVGRSGLLEELAAAWKDVAAGGRRVVFVAGEPGIGKTRLCRELAVVVHDGGGIVLFGSCDEAVDVAYRPWIEALEHLVAHGSQALIDAVGRRRLADLGPVLPAVLDRVPDLEAPARGDAEADRYRFFSAVSASLAAAAELSPVLLVLDDLHWVDRPSLALLRHVITSPHCRRVMVAGTYRDAEIVVDHPLADMLAASWREAGVDRISLHGLDDREVLNLVEATAGERLGSDGVAFAHALRRETDGNPFFACEVMRHLSESGLQHLALGNADDDAILELPESVREVVGRRVQRLGSEIHASLTAAAVVGVAFELDVLAATLDVGVEDLLDRLERAEDAGIVRATEPGWFRFTHAIVRHTLYDELRPTRRARLHRSVAEALEALGRHERAPAQLARHWAAAVTSSDVVKAIDYSRRAGDAALTSVAPEQAAEHYRHAVELLRNYGDDAALECELLCCIAEALRFAGDPAYREVSLEAADAASRLGRTDLLVRAALTHYKLAASGYDQERHDVLVRALDAVGDTDSPDRARLLAFLASIVIFVDGPGSKAASEEAEAIARRLDDPTLLLEVLSQMVLGTWEPDSIERMAEELDLALRHGGDDAIARAACRLYQAGYITADAHAIAEGRRIAAEVSATVHHPEMIWELRYHDADHLIMVGQLTRAEELAEEAWEIGRRTGQPGALTVYAALMMMIRWHQGRGNEAFSLVAQAAAGDPSMTLLRVDADSRPLPEQVADLRYDAAWLASLQLLAERVARAGDRDLITNVYTQLLPHARIFNKQGPYCRGAVSHHLALLAAADGRRADAARHFADADELNRRVQAPFYTARTSVEWARFLQASEESTAVAPLLTEAVRVAAAHGYGAIEARARRLLASASRL